MEHMVPRTEANTNAVRKTVPKRWRVGDRRRDSSEESPRRSCSPLEWNNLFNVVHMGGAYESRVYVT